MESGHCLSSRSRTFRIAATEAAPALLITTEARIIRGEKVMACLASCPCSGLVRVAAQSPARAVDAINESPRVADTVLVGGRLGRSGGLSAVEPANLRARDRQDRSARRTTGARIEVASLTSRVSFSDLDLTENSGVAELRNRINAAAKADCAQLETDYLCAVYPPDPPGQDRGSRRPTGPAVATQAIGDAAVRR